MEIIKKIEFTEREEEALNTVIDIWRSFYKKCNAEECSGCIFRGFCDSPLEANENSNCLHKIKENLKYRI